MKITKTKTYTVAKERLKNPIEVKFMNKKGSFCCMQFTRSIETDLKNSTSTYNNSISERVGRINTKKTNTYFSPYFRMEYQEWAEELINSPVVLIDGKYVKLEDSSYSFDNDSKHFSLVITVTPQFTTNNIRF